MWRIGFVMLVCLSSASAADMTMSWQGRLTDTLGQPVEGGDHTVVMSLWNDADSTTLTDRLHLETYTQVAPDGGYVGLTLGTESTLDSTVFGHAEVWLQVQVDGAVMGQRTLLTSVPMAARAVETTRFATATDSCDGSDATDIGLVRFDGTTFEGCTADGWQSFVAANGSAPASALDSCFDILQAEPTSSDGVYWLDPTDSSPFQAYCDMSNGGWTLVARMTIASRQAHHNTNAVGVSATSAVSPTHHTTQKFSDARIAQIRAASNYSGTTAYKMDCWEGGSSYQEMFCSSSCSFGATTLSQNTPCSLCGPTFEGGLTQLTPNTGTIGMGHHHDLGRSWTIAYQRHPEQGTNYGCRTDSIGNGNGHLWVR